VDESVNGSWAAGVSAITLFADDLAATRDFYLRVFRRPAVFEDDDSIAFDFDGLVGNILRASEAGELIEPARVGRDDEGVRFQLTLTVRDVDAVCAHLATVGVELLNGPSDRPWGVRTAAFRDPAGHVWEVAASA
jgi:catechol 2,3-dioxygenase-like lactoylglutathione lyase family enzyme